MSERDEHSSPSHAAMAAEIADLRADLKDVHAELDDAWAALGDARGGTVGDAIRGFLARRTKLEAVATAARELMDSRMFRVPEHDARVALRVALADLDGER